MTVVITAALPYVNAPPHVGHALELVQVDALARERRLAGETVLVVSGTDDNSLKNVRAAAAEGLPVPALVERNARRFTDLAERLDVRFDGFTHTGLDPTHRRAVHELWRRVAARGDLYRSRYRGLYCVGCEQFFSPEELDGRLCPEHGVPPEPVEEDNWFFRLSRYDRVLRDSVERDELSIVPESKQREVLAFIGAGLRDFSVSRSLSRARGWGVPVPDDPDQVVFVWFDALAGYLSALRWPDADSPWLHAKERAQVIGKGILRFHAVYWPAILASAGLELPNSLLVHGYLTLDGKKIGKSLGNAVDPQALVERHGAEALRWYLLRHAHSSKDSDFSLSRFDRAHDGELADQLGNLCSRVETLIARFAGGRLPQSGALGPAEERLIESGTRTTSALARAFTDFALHDAAAQAFELVGATNRYLDETAPWRLARESSPRLDGVLYAAAEGLRWSAALLAPLLPLTSRRIAERLGVGSAPLAREWGQGAPGSTVALGPPLFPRSGPRVS